MAARKDPYRSLKDAFGRYATGVALAGCIGKAGAPVVITVNSFTSVSLKPPLVLWCIENTTWSFPHFMAADAYSIAILMAEQQAVSERFADHSPKPLAPDEYEIWETGAPIFKHRLAAFDCRVKDRHRAGDHVILIAEVVKFDARTGRPLLYFASDYDKGPEAAP